MAQSPGGPGAGPGAGPGPPPGKARSKQQDARAFALEVYRQAREIKVSSKAPGAEEHLKLPPILKHVEGTRGRTPSASTSEHCSTEPRVTQHCKTLEQELLPPVAVVSFPVPGGAPHEHVSESCPLLSSQAGTITTAWRHPPRAAAPTRPPTSTLITGQAGGQAGEWGGAGECRRMRSRHTAGAL